MPPMYRHNTGGSVLEPAECMVLMARATGPQPAPGLSTPGHFVFVIIIMHIAMMLPSGIASAIMYIAVSTGVRTQYMLEVKRHCITQGVFTPLLCYSICCPYYPIH